MREIKFRMWCKFESGNCGMLDNDCLKEWTLEDLTDGEDVVMQYTGLKDKNGKEIYEFDIVTWEDGTKEVVEYKKSSFTVTKIGTKDTVYLSDLLPVSEERVGIEIIGNIYENPELLK